MTADRPSFKDLELRIAKLEEQAEKHGDTEKRLRLIASAAEQSSEGLAVSDLEGNLWFVNSAFARMHGYTPRELEGRNISVFHTPEQMPAVEESIRFVNETGKFSGELWHWHRERGEFPALMQNTILRDEENNPIGMVGTLIDITERKRAENLMRIQRDLGIAVSMAMNLDDVMRLCVEASLKSSSLQCGGVYLVDKSTGAIDLASHWGLSHDFVEKASHYDAGSPNARLVMAGEPVYIGFDEMPSFLNELAHEEGLQALAVIPIKQEGQILGCLNIASRTLVEISPIARDALEAIASQIGGAVATRQTEREMRQLEAQFQQAQKMEAIGILAGGIAHDFNNLLSVIKGNASVILFGMDPTHKDYEALEDIEEAAQAASTLTNQLLGFARNKEFEPNTISLNQLIRGTFEAFARTKKDITVRRKLADDLHTIEADENQINQVLLNILINASDAMPEGGEIYIKTENMSHENLVDVHPPPKPGKYVLLSVTDNGEGMEKEVQEHIFEPFFTTKARGRGVGLGLASVYGTIQKHGGYIAVNSEKGRGTTISIYLPASSKRNV